MSDSAASIEAPADTSANRCEPVLWRCGRDHTRATDYRSRVAGSAFVDTHAVRVDHQSGCTSHPSPML
jgi:hypothetical protein